MSAPGLKYCPSCGECLDAELRELRFGVWRYDEAAHTLLEPVVVRFTYSQGALFAALMRAEGRLLSKSGGLYSAICGNRPDADWPELKIVDVYVCKIRAMLRKAGGPAHLIETLWGHGYRLKPNG